ncbi:MAG: dihydrofolate reductase [Flavobacteriaceae bacterium]
MKHLKKIVIISIVFFTLLATSCKKESQDVEKREASKIEEKETFVEQFSDIKVLRYKIPQWDKLSLKQQKLVYYLTEAGLSGRDIMYDQNYRHNLKIRRALEQVYATFKGDKTTKDWKFFETYLKKVWFANGIHHHYANDKFKPAFSKTYFNTLLKETKTTLTGKAYDVVFNAKDAKKVNLDTKKGLILGSAVNFYGANVTAKDVDTFYGKLANPNDKEPVELGLNSQLVKENGVLKERVYKSGGLYGKSIDKIIYWLKKAKTVAENEKQAKALGVLIDYYITGDLQKWNDYNVLWATNTEGDIDYINGFIEVYNDPKGYRGSYETIVEIKDFEMSKKMAIVAESAQWFEDNSSIMENHKKKNVVGVSYKTVNVAGEAGDASPSTPIGVNLPNNNWIRQQHGSKSVSLGNIIAAYAGAGGTGRLKEFTFTDEEFNAEVKYGGLADKLHTALHEVVGHASGLINPGIGQPKETMKNYASTLEEARADLVGLYFLPSEKLVEMGISPSAKGIGKAAFDGYIRNGLMTQLIRLDLGADIEEAHMRNRQLVAAWAFEKGAKDKVIEKVVKDNKTYFVVRDYKKLRVLFGELLREIQRIKSEGDFEAGRDLVENYGVKVDQKIHAEVLKRNSKFKSAPYSGFVNPVLVANKDADGKITRIDITQPDTFAEQMLDYAKRYTTLPDKN